MSVDLVTKFDNYTDIVNGLRFLKDNQLYIGIPEDETDRKESSDVTNAELLFIHTNGSPVNNIPPRPVIEPVIKRNSAVISKKMKEIYNLAVDGERQTAEDKLKLLGEWTVGKVRRWFVDPNNGWAPNAPSVIRAKMKKGSTNPKPLIDTAELRKSITFVIRKEGRK